MKQFVKSLIPTVLLLATSSAWALSYDQNVNANGPAAPAGNGAGIYWGSGNANGGWTVDINNNVELGLRTHVRYNPTVPANVFNSSGNGVYSYTDQNGNGLGPVVQSQNRSSWNYDFSVNVNQSGAGSGLLADYKYMLAVDYNPGIGQTWSFVNILLIPDNAPPASGNILQNSENARFAAEGLPGYINTIPGTYDFVLAAFNGAGSLVAQTYMRVNVNGGTATGPLTSAPSVPDAASTIMLFGAAFSGMALLRRKMAS